MDAETGKGLVTDVCLKRKVRNYVQITQTEGEGANAKAKSRYDIFVKAWPPLNKAIDNGYTAASLDPEAAKKSEKEKDKGPKRRAEIKTAREKMCELFYDIRTFGAVLSTGANAGQVRGPVQLTFARSVDPVVALEHSITRVAITKEEDAAAKVTEFWAQVHDSVRPLSRSRLYLGASGQSNRIQRG